MTPLIMDRLNRSISQLDENYRIAQSCDVEIKEMKTSIFVKSAKDIASSNESMWNRIFYAHKNKK